MNSATSHPRDVFESHADIFLEMWFRWHQALWSKVSNLSQAEQLSYSSLTEGPPLLFLAVQSVFFSSTFGHRGLVREYRAKLAQLKIASMHMWNFQRRRFPNALTSSFRNASALFQQIILANRKASAMEDFVGIQKLLLLLHKNVMTGVEIKDDDLGERDALLTLDGLLRRSEHAGLIAVLDALVLPCAVLLYETPWRTLNTFASLFYQGRVWLLLGLTRLQLLKIADGCHPVSKYYYKHGRTSNQLTNVNLNIKVRQKSELTIRGSGTSPKSVPYNQELKS